LAQGQRRHVKASTPAFRSVVVWGVFGLAAGCGLLIAFGIPWWKALLGSGGLLLILLVAYGLEQSGLLRPPSRDESARPDRRSPPPKPPMR
jgi:hypothetical protein